RGTVLRIRLLSAQPDEVRVLRDALALHPGHAGIDELRRLVGNDWTEPGARLRAACALAVLQPGLLQPDPPAPAPPAAAPPGRARAPAPARRKPRPPGPRRPPPPGLALRAAPLRPRAPPRARAGVTPAVTRATTASGPMDDSGASESGALARPTARRLPGAPN